MAEDRRMLEGREALKREIEYEVAPGPYRPSSRTVIISQTGQRLYPAIEFEDGTWTE